MLPQYTARELTFDGILGPKSSMAGTSSNLNGELRGAASFKKTSNVDSQGITARISERINLPNWFVE